MMIKNEHGVAINYEAALMRMNLEIKGEVREKLGECDECTFFSEYCKSHRARFGVEFASNTPDPDC